MAPYGTQPGSRTQNILILSQSPLPIGLVGHNGTRTRTQTLNPRFRKPLHCSVVLYGHLVGGGLTDISALPISPEIRMISYEIPRFSATLVLVVGFEPTNICVLSAAPLPIGLHKYIKNGTRTGI